MPEYILLGEISGVSGLKGWVKVFSHTSPRLQITEYSHWFLQKKDDAWRKVKIKNGRTQGKNIIASLEGIQYRDQAEALIGTKIAVSSDQLDALPKGEYYWKDLIGLKVETTEGVALGKVDWLFNSGSNDVIVVKQQDEHSREVTERLLPYVRDEVVIRVDLDESLMVVDWDPEF